jgi:glycerol-1-phosphate dehydrogenase [NAD(P)+]
MHHCWNLPIIRYGSLTEINDTQTVTVLYSKGTWEAVESKLNLIVANRIEITEATIDYWDSLLSEVQGEAIYAIGGGLVVDAAKYLAVKRSLRLICIPTVISVDAFLTWASGFRSDGCVKYMETKPPEEVIVDFDIIRNAPFTVRSAGITDVLSIVTGRFDWKYAHEAGRNPEGMEYDPAVDDMIESILNASIACAESAGRGEDAGLKRLFECLAMEVQLCNFIGHARPEEGSEHYFAYAAEQILGKGLPHGDLVGPGIMIAARLQGQDTTTLEKAMRNCNVPLNKIPADTAREILRTLPEYCIKHDLAYGIAHNLSEEKINALNLDFIDRD